MARFCVGCIWYVLWVSLGKVGCLLGLFFLVDNRSHLRIETLNCRHPVLCSQVHTSCSDETVSFYRDWLQQQRDRLLAERSWASSASYRGCCCYAVLGYIMRSVLTVTWFIVVWLQWDIVWELWSFGCYLLSASIRIQMYYQWFFIFIVVIIRNSFNACKVAQKFMQIWGPLVSWRAGWYPVVWKPMINSDLYPNRGLVDISLTTCNLGLCTKWFLSVAD